MNSSDSLKNSAHWNFKKKTKSITQGLIYGFVYFTKKIGQNTNVLQLVAKCMDAKKYINKKSYHLNKWFFLLQVNNKVLRYVLTKMNDIQNYK